MKFRYKKVKKAFFSPQQGFGDILKIHILVFLSVYLNLHIEHSSILYLIAVQFLIHV